MSPVTMQHLRVFTTICACGGMTAAAETLSTNQPALSQTIAELEGHFNTKLFDRMGRKLHLTRSGRRLLQYARYIISAFDEMECTMVQGAKAGALRIAASITIGSRLLPHYVNALQQRSPDVQLNVTVTTNEDVESLILSNEVDFGLMEGPSQSPLLIRKNFMEDQMVFLCSPEHPWASRSTITMADLRDQKYILRAKGTAGREILDNILTLQGIAPQIAWESVSTPAVLEAVQNNLGVSLLSLRMVECAVRDGSVHIVTLEGFPLHRDFAVVYHKNKYLSPAAEDFISLCLEDNRS